MPLLNLWAELEYVFFHLIVRQSLRTWQSVFEKVHLNVYEVTLLHFTDLIFKSRDIIPIENNIFVYFNVFRAQCVWR